MKCFSVKQLCAGYGKKKILHDICIDIPADTVTAIVGSNGCGKTTLLKCMAGIIKPFSGNCYIDGTVLSSIAPRERARRIAFCSQQHPDCSYLTVKELVAMGRHPYGNESEKVSAQAVEEALQLADICEFSNCRLGELSSGTIHRAWLALALAQQPELLLLDEPTNFLDPLKKQQLSQIFRYLKQEKNTTVVLITHDINFIANSAENVIALKNGSVLCQKTAQEMMSDSVLSEIYISK